MKKLITILLCAVLAVSTISFLTACDGLGSPATKIQVVDAKTEYFVGESIDYDNLSVKITYEDGTTKQGTLSQLKLSVDTRADLSKAGSTSYTVSYGGLTCTVNITVTEEYVEPAKAIVQAIALPSFYTNYINKSADRAEGVTETRADFRLTGEMYEVGNVNKFIFRPTLRALDENFTEVTITNPQTTVEVYEKLNADDEYVLVPDTDLEGLVQIENNTYKFSEEAAGRYYRVEITPDAEVYDLSNLRENDRTISFECKVIANGYNVYDQLGMSVVNDIASQRWVDIWKCDIDEDFNLISREDSLVLEADDKPLCEYVGNIDWAIMHTSFTLNADLMPDYYFWTEETEGYQTAYDSLSAYPEWQADLVGTLRDGINNDAWFQVGNIKNGTLVPFGGGINMQKAFFATVRVSVSGNYNSITTPTTPSEGGRKLYSLVDHDSGTAANNPSPHWEIFQMYQSKIAGKQYAFTLKNIALTGNTAQQDTQSLVPAGLAMVNCYGNEINLKNIVGNNFYANVTCDFYGDTGYTSENFNGVNIESVKLYNSYSNMLYLWRSSTNVVNCELIGSGGPLFILCDGTQTTQTTSDDGGPNLTVDESSVLQAYATGAESWYALYNAQALVSLISGQLEPVFNSLYKTLRFVPDGNGNMVPYTNGASGLQYLNVIAAIICEPGDLLAGLTTSKQFVRGTYTTVDAEGNTVEQFKMRNDYVNALSAAVEHNGTMLPVVFQTGSLMAYTDGQALYTLGATGPQAFNPATDGVAWATDTHDKIAIYMSAGSQSHSQNAPYFGVILGSSAYSPA